MKILYYDCFSGISGDMNLGAMIDLGVDKDYINKQLAKLNINEFELDVKKDSRKGISGTNLNVLVNHNHEHDHHMGHHHHRNLEDITNIIMGSQLNDNIKNISMKIFMQVAKAEAKVHNCDINSIHFHEVGAVDSIVDIIGAAICFDYLNADKIISSPIELGSGFVKCAHGLMPVPAPATAEILTGMPVTTGKVSFEATTPTGAAILKTMVNEFSMRNHFKTIKVGYGIGNKDIGDIPNVLRVMLAEDYENEENDFEKSQAYIIECNLDDMNPEIYNYIVEKMFNLGASDVYLTPIIMKKGRPGTKISVLCSIEKEAVISSTMLRETTTLGIRKYKVTKDMLQRKFKSIETKYGDISIKVGLINGKEIKYKPEYKDCKTASEKFNVPIKDIYDEVERELIKVNIYNETGKSNE
ncbi:nickel pincer cofactor biosynthesis protein LarC [Clostridium sp. JN-9]|uniref:nickel pincer cofactor biosynthesis protein LarC n=1 Tax=Clostridium sp. JN-9 TaxID=2507159 RepID=UPI000FFE2689|nr:nickel pincer cofactor biosynthesis protein LarC [Clostridium sp. JN-9]QAT38939.1 nickel pincer cofactor biosynthesis protein LarC [Clostridium sp. JN-9]